MKIIGFIIFLIFCSFSSFGQFAGPAESPKNQYFIGIRVNTIDYNLYFNKKPYYGDVGAAPVLHFGLKLAARSAIQIGLAYGGQNSLIGSDYYNEDSIYVTDLDYRKTKAILIPLTWRYTLNPTKRFQFFGSASIVPTYGGITSTKKPAVVNGVTPTTYQEKVNGFNAFITGTLGLNYKISKRWEGYGESILFHRNLRGSFSFDTFRYIGFGINYNL